MTDARLGQVAGTAAQTYQDFFVPALFGQFSGPLLDAAGVGPGDRVLDVGCGTGVVARAAATRVGGEGRVTGLDVNESMLAVAVAEAGPDGGGLAGGRGAEASAPIEWRLGEAEALPFPDAAFDRVVSSFALMFFRDRAAALAEMRRVTAPGGRVALCTWAGVDHSPGYRAMVGLLDRVVGPEAADALRAPFVLGDEAAVRAVVGPVLGEVTVEATTGTARFASLDAWLHTEIRGWVLAGSIDDPTFEHLRREARSALGALADPGTGRVVFPAPALLAVAEV